MKTLSTAQTIGCFQIESGGMRFTLRELAAQNIDDLIVALALYRPGPLKGGLKDAFVRRHLGQEPTEYLHPALEPILRETYGVVLYQEQVLRIAHEVAGFTLGEADLLRRAMSKFRSAHEMAQLRQHVTRLVKVPVFAEWTGYLWQAGQAAMLLRPTRSSGDVALLTLTLDADAWTWLITGGLSTGIIALPATP